MTRRIKQNVSDCPDLKVRVYTDARGTETVAGPMVDDQSDAIVIFIFVQAMSTITRPGVHHAVAKSLLCVDGVSTGSLLLRPENSMRHRAPQPQT